MISSGSPFVKRSASWDGWISLSRFLRELASVPLAELVVVDQLGDLSRAARGTFRILLNRERAERHRHRVDRQQLADERLAQAEKQLDCFGGLDGSDEPRNHSEHAGFGAARYEMGRRRIAEETAITGSVGRTEYRRLSLEAVDAPVYVRESRAAPMCR